MLTERINSGSCTRAFRVSPQAVTGVIARRWASRYWPFLVAVPGAFILFGSVTDLRWVLVGITLLFLILPPVVIFILLSHALRPESRYSVALHTIRASCKGLNFRRITPMSCRRQPFPPIAKPLRPLRGAMMPEEIIPYSRITSVEQTERYTILSLDSSPFSIILLPREEAALIGL